MDAQLLEKALRMTKVVYVTSGPWLINLPFS